MLHFIINNTKIQHNKQYEIVLNHLKLEVKSKGINSYLDRIGIFILFKRVTRLHGLFPSWEGLGVGSFPRFHEDKGREISVHPVRKCGRGFKLLPHCIFSKLLPFGRRLLSNGVNISRITALPTPNPSQEGNNPCRPVTRINKMKLPIQSSYKPSRGIS